MKGLWQHMPSAWAGMLDKDEEPAPLVRTIVTTPLITFYIANPTVEDLKIMAPTWIIKIIPPPATTDPEQVASAVKRRMFRNCYSDTPPDDINAIELVSDLIGREFRKIFND